MSHFICDSLSETSITRCPPYLYHFLIKLIINGSNYGIVTNNLHIFCITVFLCVRRSLFFWPSGKLKVAGDLLVNPEMAVTLQAIADDPMTFYTGALAQKIVDDISDYGRLPNTNIQEQTLL